MSLIPLKRNKQEWDHDNHPYSFDNPNIYMRPATEDDVDNMYSWEMESIDKSLQEDPKVQQLIRDDCYQSIKDTQMIMDQDKTIGMFTACMIDNGDWRYIGEIYLIPEYRGQHIGSTILKNEIANYDRIRLQVAYDNENALRLYKSLGFKIVKENKEAKLYIMEYDKSLPVTEAFFKEAYLKAKERNSLKDSEFGIPELRKYPLTDETHINMAVKFFGKAPKKYKLSLAKRILRAAHSHDMDTDGWDTINDYIKNHKESVVHEGFVEVGFDNLRKTVTVTNVQNPTSKEAKKSINESYTERKNFIMKEQITKILEAYNSGVLTQEEASEKIEAIQEEAVEKVVQEDAYTQKLKDMANNWDEDYFQAYNKVADDAYKEVKYGPDGKPEDPAKYDDWLKKHHFVRDMKALRPKHFEFRNAKEHDDYYNKLALGDSERAKKIINSSDAKKNEYANRVTKLANEELGIKESAIMDNLRVKQDKIMESFKMGIINATEGMRLIERVMMEADYITEEEDTAYEGDDDNEPEDITPEDTNGDTVDSDDTNIDALADYINSLSDDEKTALMSKLSGSDEPTDDDANGNEEVPTDDASEGEPTTEETVDPASVSDASLNDANASLDDMEV